MGLREGILKMGNVSLCWYAGMILWRGKGDDAEDKRRQLEKACPPVGEKQ